MQDSITTVYSKDVMYGFIICEYKNLNMKKTQKSRTIVLLYYYKLFTMNV